MSTSNRWQIHRHLAEEADARLVIVKQIPQRITLIGADADISHNLLAKRYPKATFAEYDPRANFLDEAAQFRKSGFLAKLTGKTVTQYRQSLTEPLPEAEADMLWANLSLITAKEPLPVFENWARHLKTDGLLFFTHFGGDSLHELLGRLKNEGITTKAPILFDMHDLGDILFDNYFYDPVMDTSKLDLTYRSAEAFWQDMETLGLWHAFTFSDETAARAKINNWLADGSLNKITIETVFGHAVKKLMLPAGESQVQFFPRKKTD